MADTGLFGRLRRLFSTDVIIRNDGEDQLKVVDINKIQVSGEYETNALVDRLRAYFDETSRTALLERRAQEGTYKKDELGNSPMTIFIG